MLSRIVCTLLLLSMAGTALAQRATPRLTQPGVARQFTGRSHIEIDLGKQNTLIIGFDRLVQIRTQSSLDSVLRLVLADYRTLLDTTSGAANTASVYVLANVSSVSRTIDLRRTSSPTTRFRFMAQATEPVQLKTQQDTLQLIWQDAQPRAYGHTSGFSAYLILNNLTDLDELLRNGGVDAKLRQAVEAAQPFENAKKAHANFDLIQPEKNPVAIINRGHYRSPFISLHILGIGAGLIRNQWVPSLNPSLEFVPGRFQRVSYSVSYLANFFFTNTPDGSIRTQRNDFATLGISVYKRDATRNETDFDKLRFGFSVGFSTYRSDSYFGKDAIRLSGELPLGNLLKIQPELYMNGFFRQVFPGLRVGFGL
jgi:hypothetical protein